MRTIAENEEKLSRLLEGEEKSLFLELVDACMEMNGAASLEYFIIGFRLGARIMLEVMDSQDGCLMDLNG